MTPISGGPSRHRKLPDVLVLHNTPSGSAGLRTHGAESEVGVLEEVAAVTAALEKLGVNFRVVGIGSIEEIPQVLSSSSESAVFNLVESLEGHPNAVNCVPALCHAFRKACTGGDTPCLMLTLDKWRTKTVLQAAGVPVPAGILVPPACPLRLDALPPGPCIVKPCNSDASEGIDERSLFSQPGPDILTAVDRIHGEFRQAAIVEQFVGQRELNVSLVQRNATTVDVLPIAEIDFSAFEPGRPRFLDYAAKWVESSFPYTHTPRIIPAPLPEDVAARIRAAVLKCWEVAGCSDYARVDLRLDADNAFYVLEVNSNPDLSPDCGFAAALQAAGMAFETFLAAALANAAARRSADTGRVDIDMAPKGDGTLTIRNTVARDRKEILRFIEATSFFYPGEIDIARSVFEEAKAQAFCGEYQSQTAVVDGKAVGWICFGPTACTVGTYDIHWIVVDRDYQGRGIGKALIQSAERKIADQGARLVVIETGGRSLYHSTRAFYAKQNYTEQARVKDFYAPGDDKIVFVKSLNGAATGAHPTEATVVPGPNAVPSQATATTRQTA